MNDASDDSNKAASSASGDAPAERKTRRRTGGPGWFAPLFWLSLCVSLVLLRFGSFKNAHFVVFHTRSGDVQGIASHKGQVLLAVSTLSLGRERALTVERDSVPAAEFDKLYHLVYGSVQGRKEFLGFGFAATQKGDIPGDATHTAFAVPHWFLALLAGIPAFRGLWLLMRYYTRPRRGRCRNCGYDLRGTGGAVAGGRCPECGEAAGEASPAGRAAGDSVVPSARTAAKVSATLLLAAAVAWALHLSRPQSPPAVAGYSPAELRAGLDRPVKGLRFKGVRLADAINVLAERTGTRIEADWNDLAQGGVSRDSPVNAGYDQEAPLRSVLRTICLRFGDGPAIEPFPADGRIVLCRTRSPAPSEYSVRVLDLRPLIDPIPDDPAPPPDPSYQRGPAPVWSLGGGTPAEETRRSAALAGLISHLQRGTSLDNWGARPTGKGRPVATNPGPVGEAYEWAGRLIVVQTEHAHWEVATLLRQFREMSGRRSNR
jgi:hypothetical protein